MRIFPSWFLTFFNSKSGDLLWQLGCQQATIITAKKSNQNRRHARGNLGAIYFWLTVCHCRTDHMRGVFSAADTATECDLPRLDDSRRDRTTCRNRATARWDATAQFHRCGRVFENRGIASRDVFGATAWRKCAVFIDIGDRHCVSRRDVAVN